MQQSHKSIKLLKVTKIFKWEQKSSWRMTGSYKLKRVLIPLTLLFQKFSFVGVNHRNPWNLVCSPLSEKKKIAFSCELSKRQGLVSFHSAEIAVYLHSFNSKLYHLLAGCFLYRITSISLSFLIYTYG